MLGCGWVAGQSTVVEALVGIKQRWPQHCACQYVWLADCSETCPVHDVSSFLKNSAALYATMSDGVVFLNAV